MKLNNYPHAEKGGFWPSVPHFERASPLAFAGVLKHGETRVLARR